MPDETRFTLQEVIDTLRSYRDRHGAPPDTVMRIELAPERSVDVDGVSWIGDAIYFTSLDTEEEMAVPDLYAALELAQRTIISLIRALPQGEASADYCAVLDEAEAADLAATRALSKARGET